MLLMEKFFKTYNRRKTSSIFTFSLDSLSQLLEH